MSVALPERRTRVAVALAVALVVAGCGGGGDNAEVASAPAAAGAPEAALGVATEDANALAHDAGLDPEGAAREVPALLQRLGLRFGLLDLVEGRRLFERETFGGNGRTCLTCHSRSTGTTSPEDAQRRHAADPSDPLFVADGSDDGQGNGTTRMRKDATVLVTIPLPVNVNLAADPSARSVTLRRGIPSTLNTPALDPVLMLDGRQPDLRAQARGAIFDHAHAAREPRAAELRRIEGFEQTPRFFSSFELLRFAYTGRAPELPAGRTDAEVRGRRFFVDAAPSGDFKTGLCAGCHSGPMLDRTNAFLPVPGVPPGSRFQSVAVSEFNAAGNPLIDFVFRRPDGTTTTLSSADPGRALITGDPDDAQSRNAFKIPSLWGVARTAPYFHDNSAKTLPDVAAHYARFFEAISPIRLTQQDQDDMVAYMRLLR